MTNYELIKQCDIKQLASFFAKRTKCNQCFLYPTCFECSVSGCKKQFQQWLEMQVKEGEENVKQI